MQHECAEENNVFKRQQNRMQQRIFEYENAFKKVMDISSYNINENAAMQIMDFMKKIFPSNYQPGGHQQNGNNSYYPSSTTMLKPSNGNAEKFHNQFRHPYHQQQQPQQMIQQGYCNYSSSFLPPQATMLTTSTGNAENIGAQLQYPQQRQQQREFPHSNTLSMSKLNLNGDSCNVPSIENEMPFVSSVPSTAVEQNVFDDEIPPKRPETLTPYQCSRSYRSPPPKQPKMPFVSSVPLTAVEQQNVFDDEIPPKRPETLTPYQCSRSYRSPPPKQPNESFEKYFPYHSKE
uniref:Uncharacterized protein n=1 Tax=Panagrolaimus davidi TaxID=227884 RepID=A0A914P8M1_9BILA